MKLQIIYRDYVRCQVVGLTQEDRAKAYNHFSIFIPSARYMPAYKVGQFDGYKRFFSLTGLFYINLLPELYSILDMSKYEIEEILDEKMIKEPVFDEIDDDYLADYTWFKGHRLEGQPVTLMEHQTNIVNSCLNNHRSIIIAATSSGKTLVSLAIARKVVEFGRFIIVEPSRDLTLQTANFFKNLGFTDVGVCGCGLRELDKKVTICTWQTINSLERRKKSIDIDDDKKILSAEELSKLLDGTIGILFDECHTIRGNLVGKLVETTFKNIPLRWGLTGTMPKEKAEYHSIVSGLGSVVYSVDSKELQDKGILAQCNVTAIKLKDDADFLTYADEMTYLSSNKDRLTFIGNLIDNITKTSGNTLVLVNRIKCGEILEDIISKLGTNCIYIDGSVDSNQRFHEYESIKTENNKCIIATSGIASTGLDIPRLFNLVLLDYSKSFIRTIQSIGRGLRLAKDKNYVNIFDISSSTQFSKKHFNERIKFYKEKQFPLKILEVDSWK